MRSRSTRSPVERLALRLALGGAAFAAAELARRRYRLSHLFNPSPEPLRSWNPADYGIPDGAAEELWIDTPDGERLHAWYCRAPRPRASGVFCHGNTGNLTISADIIPHLRDAGLSILFFDYRGFGRSSGRATLPGVIADAVTAARFHETLRPPHLPSILYGFSLGGAIAAQVLQRHPFDALILQSTFTSLTQLARVLHPRTHLLAGRAFDTIRVVRRLRIPLLVIHGTEDEAIPFEMARAIYDACPAPKRMHSIEGGLHKDLFEREGDALSQEIGEFLRTLNAER